MTSSEGSTCVKLNCGSIATGATLYSGAVHIPICYGSVAIPTPSPQRSHLYRRICYLRDGADLPLDAYYRWRWSQEASLRQLSQQQLLACSSAAGSRKKRDRSESSTDHQSSRSFRHMGTLCSPAPSSHNEKETEVLVESPSPLYAMLDHVDFVLPKSFPHTRRSVFEPPFMVEDDTWAEHMVEIHLFFKAELLILPMILLHPCRLYPSDSLPPRFSPPSPATAVSNGTLPVKKRHAEDSSVSGTGSTGDRDNSHGKAELQTIVSERKDAIRIFHPSVGVVHFLNGVHAFAQKSFSEAEYQHFLQSVYYNKKQMPQGGGAERWRLRHEEEIETYARGRFERSLATLRNVVADLRQEQEDLVDNVSTTMARIIEEAYKVQLMMNAIHGIVVCGPSGVGKGTLLWRLMKEYSNRFGFSVSHTSRPPRDHEVDGVDYHFVDEKTILELNRTNNLIEMGYIHGKYYATSVAAFKKVQDEGKVCILEIDVNAVETIQKVPDLNAVYVFVSAPREDLRTRIVRRGSCTEKDVETRLKTAEYELDFLERHPDYFQCVVENIDCDLAYHQLVDFLQKEFIAHGMKELK